MRSRPGWTRGAVVAVLLGGAALFFWEKVQGGKLSEVKFVLGQNIVEAAKNSGVPRFAARDVAGLVSYSVNELAPSVPVRYVKPGFEISWQPVFSLTMYADRDWGPGLQVETVNLQLHVKSMTDAEAQTFVESTIAQFQQGKWKRFGDPKTETLLTGRSSYLDEHGNFLGICMNMDPNFKIPKEDWVAMSARGMYWQWLGDGILAELSVNNSPEQDGKPAYRIDLEFNVLDVKRKRDAANLARELQEGDAKGWNSTAEYLANQKELAETLRKREAAALKRGDSVLPTPSN